MSIRRRILIAFISIILLTVLLNLGIGLWSTQRNLQQFTVEIGQAEAVDLSTILSHEYTASDGWENIEPVIFDFGYGVPTGTIVENGVVITEYDDEIPIEVFNEVMFAPFGRVVVVDMNNFVLLDSFAELEPGTEAPILPGEISPIFDLRTNQEVGAAIVEVDGEFLQPEITGTLFAIVSTSIIGGLITALVAIVFAAWFSNRITSPITALINATNAIAKQEEPDLLPVTSKDELGQMSESFNQMTLAMRTQRSLRKRLINDVSHEISTPLSVIQLEAKGLKDELQPPAEAAEQIMLEVNLLRNMVHDLNWLAETDSGELRLNLGPADLPSILENEVGRWRNQAESQNVSLILQELPDLAPMQLDSMRISQVFGNLIRNALQHSNSGGEIDVSAVLGSDSVKDGSHIAIIVSDNGAGISPADLPHVLERFYRADESRNRISGGRGLGLAIVKTLVEAHGGTIGISSAGIGKGTTVKVELPIDPTFS